MKKSLRRVLERLRAATNGALGKRTATRGGAARAAADDRCLGPCARLAALARAHRDRLHVPAAGLRDRHVLGRPARALLGTDTVDASPISSPSCTSRRARSGEACSRRSRRPSAATTSAPRGCSAGSTSTSCCSSTSTGSSAAATASTCCRSREELAQPLVVTLHTVLSEPTPHQAEVLTELCERGRARDRDDRHGARLLVESGACPRRRCGSSRTARRCASPRAARERRPTAVHATRAERSVPALDVRPDLARQGARDGDRGAAGDDRTAPRGRLHDRGPHASGRRAPRGRAVPPHARAARARARPRRPRRVRRSVPLASTSSPTCSPRPTSS